MSGAEWSCPPVDLDSRAAADIVAHWSNDEAQLAFRLREQGLYAEIAILGRAMDAVGQAIEGLDAR